MDFFFLISPHGTGLFSKKKLFETFKIWQCNNEPPKVIGNRQTGENNKKLWRFGYGGIGNLVYTMKKKLFSYFNQLYLEYCKTGSISNTILSHSAKIKKRY